MNNYLEVNAAGGLVINKENEFLLIHRNGKWELPKGKQEHGEDLADTAVREVMEETGIDSVTLGKFICTTNHTYFRDGKWHLKHTSWYNMSCESKCAPCPQIEEGIDSVKWVKFGELPPYLKDSYGTILEVFEKALSQKYQKIEIL